MKKILYTLLLVAVTTTQLAQAAKIRDYFIMEPGNLFLTLSQGTRAGMITTAEEKRESQADNRMGGVAKITTLDDDYMTIETSPCKSVELKLLTKGTKDTVIAVIETVKLPVTDSRISFYSTKWKPLKTKKHFKQMPTIKDFLLPNAKKGKAKEVLSNLHFPLIVLKFSGPQHQQVVATQQLKKFYSEEDYQKMGKFLKDSINYSITGTEIILTK